MLHGDANGVTNIPLEIATEVADIGEEFMATEDIVMDYVKPAGEKQVQEFRQRFDQFVAAVGQLRKRVSRQT